MPNRRWLCPLDAHTAVLAPEKGMRLDDVRRYCLDCSVEKGRLVKRVCPAASKNKLRLEEKRKAKAKRKALKTRPLRKKVAAENVEKKRRARQNARMSVKHRLALLEKPDSSYYLLSGIDLHEQLEHLLSLEAMPLGLRTLAPNLQIRNCEKPPQKWGSAGWKDGRGLIRLSVWPGIGPGAMLGHLCHELAHLMTWHERVQGTHHGPEWREAYVGLATRGYGVRVEIPRGPSRQDLDDVVALALSVKGQNMMRHSKAQRSANL